MEFSYSVGVASDDAAGRGYFPAAPKRTSLRTLSMAVTRCARADG